MVSHRPIFYDDGDGATADEDVVIAAAEMALQEFTAGSGGKRHTRWRECEMP